MRTATLYTAGKQHVRVYGDSIPYHIRKPVRLFNDYNSYLDGEEAINIHYLPVERWVFDNVEHLIALDPTLRDIVNSMIHTSEDVVRRFAQVKIDKLNDEIKRLQARTVWDMIRSKIKQRWLK